MLLSVGRPLPRLLPRARHRPPRVHPLMPLPLEPSQPAQRHGRAHDATRHAAAQPAAAAIILPAGPRVDLGGELGRQQRAPQPQDDGENRRRCGRGRRERAADPMIAIYRIVTARECCRVACARLFNRSTSLVFEGMNRPASVAEEAPVSTCTCACACQVHRRDHRKSGYFCDHKAPGSGDSTTPISILHFVLAHEHHSCLLILLIYSTPPPFQLVYEYTSSSHLPLPWHPCTSTRPRALLPTLTLALTIRSQTIHPYNTPTRPIPIEPLLSLTRSLRAPRLLTDARGIPVALTQQPS